MEKAGIVGLGLIGGSLAKSLKKKCGLKYIYAIDHSMQSLQSAFEDGIIDGFEVDPTDDKLKYLFGECNIIFICVPVDQTLDYCLRLQKVITKNCLITDVGSTKSSICSSLLSYDGINFIGGHPMAGSEKSGYLNSTDYLFENAYYILTPLPWIKIETRQQISELVNLLGAIPLFMDANDHDMVTAAISHAPHIIAVALVNMVKRMDNKSEFMHMLAAGGFKDLTRMASSQSEMWSAICFDNAEYLLEVLKEFMKELEYTQQMLKMRNKLNGFFNSAKIYRDSFTNNIPGAYKKSFVIRVDVEDRPGSIATISTLLSVNGININNIGVLHSREYQNGVLEISFDNEEDKIKSIDFLQKMNYGIYD